MLVFMAALEEERAERLPHCLWFLLVREGVLVVERCRRRTTIDLSMLPRRGAGAALASMACTRAGASVRLGLRVVRRRGAAEKAKLQPLGRLLPPLTRSGEAWSPVWRLTTAQAPRPRLLQTAMAAPLPHPE